jgi:pimeloyl-ACP methyl ester carboxylesterase
MIYGARDVVARNERLADLVPHVTEVELDCGHWIMDEKPQETTNVILTWLDQHAAAPTTSAGARA